jgi:hypothetical protein
MTITELRTYYASQKHDISDVGNDLFLSWCNRIDDFLYRFLQKVDPERFITTQDYVVGTSPQTNALPTTFSNMNTFGTGLYYLNGSTETNQSLPKTNYGASNKGYYIKGGNIVFTGMSNETYRMRFVPKRTQYTALTEDLLLDEEYLTYLLNAVDVLYSIWDEDLGMESYADVRFTRALDELASSIKKESYSYGLNDYTLNY